MFLTTAQASSTLGVSSCTFRRWHHKGKITAFRSPGDVSSIVRSYTITTTSTPKVTSTHESQWYQPQEARLVHHTGTSKSLNGHRSCGCHRDRLYRFAYDFIEYILKLNGAKLVVLSQDGFRNNKTELQRKKQQQQTQEVIEINSPFKTSKEGRSLKIRILWFSMVFANFNYDYLSTLKLKISYIHEWYFMKDCPYEVLDHVITEAIQARDEVIRQNNELLNNNYYSRHHLHFQKRR
ncbi:hypothetical protein Glove_189g19 [Diversispora epigaea]|uniref:Uncharacterized protein n=1 Tax=Diversispora epigaea TaxID=1348612 RepID=A0A397IPC6_9GLOM|nr:hypothetical protein Glove_189g19 [Diversispora epigaea]